MFTRTSHSQILPVNTARYIEQCVLAIDDTDSMVREHIPNVLGNLVNALTTKEKALASHQPAKVLTNF